MKQIECLEMEIIVIKISPDKLNSMLDTSKEKINQTGRYSWGNHLEWSTERKRWMVQRCGR